MKELVEALAVLREVLDRGDVPAAIEILKAFQEAVSAPYSLWALSPDEARLVIELRTLEKKMRALA